MQTYWVTKNAPPEIHGITVKADDTLELSDKQAWTPRLKGWITDEDPKSRDEKADKAKTPVTAKKA